MRSGAARLDFSAYMLRNGEKLRALLEERGLLEGPVLLSTGQTSNFYFDCRRVTLNSEGASLVADAFLAVIDSLPQRPDAIGGLTHGADPIIGAVQMRALEHGEHYEAFYVRKAPKEHGTRQWIENPPERGSKVVIVDDVVTTGRSIILAIDKAREIGCTVVAVIALVDREQGGGEVIREVCADYRFIYSLKDFPKLRGLVQASRR
jgi:orotate phosphoribosyltransferase